MTYIRQTYGQYMADIWPTYAQHTSNKKGSKMVQKVVIRGQPGITRGQPGITMGSARVHRGFARVCQGSPGGQPGVR